MDAIGKKESNLAKRAMLVSLSVGLWSANKTDREVSDTVASQYGATSRAGKYRKRLLPQQEPLEAVRKAASAAREFHYHNTLPWSQDGSRILPKDNYFKYVEAMRKFRGEFEKAVKEFLKLYPSLVAAAQGELGSMYRPEEYPNQADIEAKFTFDNVFMPFPDEKDFRVEIGEEEVKEIKRSLRQKSNEAVADAMQDAWSRLYAAVSHMSERLSDSEAVFHGTLVSNLVELCDVLPRLNINEDANLDEMVNQVKAKLTVEKPETLRKNKEVRKAVADDAKNIIEAMSAYMGGSVASL